MSTINRVMVMGRLGKDPHIAEFKNGNKVAMLAIATNESYKTKDGEWVEKTEWHDCKSFFPKQVEGIEKNLKQGDVVYVEGKIETESFTNKDGVEIKKKVIMIDVFKKIYVKFTNDKSGVEISGAKPSYPEPKESPLPSSLEDEELDDLPF